jgi:ATP-dependent Clp endopeptidase proteolytic subunit ClpP
MKTWFNVGKTPEAPVAIFDEIGAYGVSAKSFLSAVGELKGSTINLEINSPGGDVFAGIAMYNGLRATGKTINVKVLGIAASAASLVAMAGDTIDMPENSMMMVHNPWSFAMGDAEEMRAAADVLDKIQMSLVATYAKRTGRKDEDIIEMLNKETWMTADEAVAAGFATRVSDRVAAQASFDVDRLPEAAKAAWAKASAPVEGELPVEPPANPVAAEPAAEPAAVVFEETLAEQIDAVAKAAGMGDYVAHWVADASILDKEAAVARATAAREINALCVFAKCPQQAAGLILANKSLADARAAVLAHLSKDDEHIDTTAPIKNTPVPGSAQPTAVKGSDIWAARNAKLSKR